MQAAGGHGLQQALQQCARPSSSTSARGRSLKQLPTCALRILLAATIFMALVIFWMLATDFMR